MMFSTYDCLPEPVSVVRLWLHEATRVYQDKLIDETDIKTYHKLVMEQVKKGFEVSAGTIYSCAL